MDDRILEDALKHIKNRFEGDSGGHDYFHSLRVCNTATSICKTEGGNLDAI